MANKGAKISPIPKEFSATFHSLDSSLAKHGLWRAPGTARVFTPYKEATGIYRTGLDENAKYLFRLSEEERQSEIKRIKEDKARLEAATGLDLSPTSSFYNFNSKDPEDRRFTPIKLGTQDALFDLTDPLQEIAWNWIRVHPSIAPSYEAWKRGDIDPSSVQYYVCDDEIEMKRTYQMKERINNAIFKFSQMIPSKRSKVARLMGLPVVDDTKPEEVYNLMDTLLKDGEFKSGEYKGNSTINTFNDIASMPDGRLHVKDLVDEAIRRNIYRQKGDRIFEGEHKIADSKKDLVESLMDDDNQEDLLALEKRLKIKKIAETI